MGLKQAALSGARWTLAARVGLQLVSWPITIVVMRLLEPGDYGLFALAMVVSGFITLFSELGLGVALVQAPAISEPLARMACTLVLLLNGVIALVICAVAPLVATAYGEPDVALVMQVLTIELLVSALAVVPLAVLERNLRFREISIGQIAGGLSSAAATLLAALLDADVWALVAGNLTGGVVRSAVWIGLSGPVRPGRLKLSVIRPMIRVSGHVLATRALWYWSGQADQLVLGRLLHAVQLGFYNVAWQLAMLPAGKVMEAVNRVAFPILSRLRSEPDGLQSTHCRITGLLALYGFGVCWGLAAVAPEFVLLVLGEKWRVASVPLALLALVAPLRMLCAFHNTVATSAGVPEAATREQVLACVVMPLAVAVGGTADGLHGACIAWLLAYPSIYLVSVFLTARAIQLDWLVALRSVAAPLLAALALLGAVWLCRQALEPQAALVWRFCAEIGVGAIAYLATLSLLNFGMLIDARALVLDIVRPARPGA